MNSNFQAPLSISKLFIAIKDNWPVCRFACVFYVIPHTFFKVKLPFCEIPFFISIILIWNKKRNEKCIYANKTFTAAKVI